jgi:MerR family redox-sensitive transcriptional activator SoxR
MLTIGQVTDRTGLAVSAIRYYEDIGLVAPGRNAGGQRRFAPAAIRRLSFVMIAQDFGFTLPRIRAELDRLPSDRAPTRRDWTRISAMFRDDLNARIAAMERLRDTLDGCIGCGCLSLRACRLYNPGDRARTRGKGPRYLIGDRPDPASDRM